MPVGADKAGMLELMMVVRSRTRNAALGNRYARSVAADIVARGGEQDAATINYVSKLIGTRFRKGWTDIDPGVKKTVGGVEIAVYCQMMNSVPAAMTNFRSMEIWVAEAVKDDKRGPFQTCQQQPQ